MSRKKLTSLTIKRIIERAKDDVPDRVIAAELGVPRSTVAHCRQSAGIHRARGYRRHRVRYTVYDRRTSQYLCEGNVEEVAAYLGITANGVRQSKSRQGAGRPTKYLIYTEEMPPCSTS